MPVSCLFQCEHTFTEPIGNIKFNAMLLISPAIQPELFFNTSQSHKNSIVPLTQRAINLYIGLSQFILGGYWYIFFFFAESDVPLQSKMLWKWPLFYGGCPALSGPLLRTRHQSSKLLPARDCHIPGQPSQVALSTEMTIKLTSNLYIGPVNIFPNFLHKKLGKIFTGPMYKLLVSFMVISGPIFQIKKHYMMSQCGPRSMPPYIVTRPQWVKPVLRHKMCRSKCFWTIVLASHLCFGRAIKLIAHPKITLILSFSWGFSSIVVFAYPQISFAHPELLFLAKSMFWITEIIMKYRCFLLQNRLQRCAMDCQDRIRDRLPPNATEADISVHRADLERCAIKCADDHVALVPNMMKRMKEMLKNTS